MKRLLAVVFLAIIVLGAWYLFFKKDKKTVAPEGPHTMAAIQHSAGFNKSIDNLIDTYLGVKDALVDWDSAAVREKTVSFLAFADSLRLDEIKKSDSSVFMAVQQNVSDIKANAQPMLLETSIAEMRQDFNMISENLYPLLKSIGYEGQKLYWQNCPMAFGEDKPANWLSKTAGIDNPYLGNKHPEYKSAMLHCGENMDSIYRK
jgi:Cu(I)/Ag(I) efflux system membrane fusion protein